MFKTACFCILLLCNTAAMTRSSRDSVVEVMDCHAVDQGYIAVLCHESLAVASCKASGQ